MCTGCWFNIRAQLTFFEVDRYSATKHNKHFIQFKAKEKERGGLLDLASTAMIGSKAKIGPQLPLMGAYLRGRELGGNQPFFNF